MRIIPRPPVAAIAVPSTETPAFPANPYAAPAAPLAASPNTPSDKSNLRYDGRTFEEWRDLWRNELSTERRTEAVKALAAFGRAGYGPEATAAILDVAGEYDFTLLDRDENPEGKLKNTIIKQLAPEYGYGRSLAEHWVPDLAARLEKDPKRWSMLAIWVLDRLQADQFWIDNNQVLDTLHSLAKDGPPQVRIAALGVLVRASRAKSGGPHIDDRTRELIVAALKSEDRIAALGAIDFLQYHPPGPGVRLLAFQPELVPLLFHAEELVRQHARGALRYIDEKDAPPVVEQLLAVLNDDARKPDHLHAIRGLAAIGPRAKPAEAKLKELLQGSVNASDRFAAGTALRLILGEESFRGLLTEMEVLDPEVLNSVETAIESEMQELFPAGAASQMGGGGGGGFF
jgi:HEAT repeat protein